MDETNKDPRITQLNDGRWVLLLYNIRTDAWDDVRTYNTKAAAQRACDRWTARIDMNKDEF